MDDVIGPRQCARPVVGGQHGGHSLPAPEDAEIGDFRELPQRGQRLSILQHSPGDQRDRSDTFPLPHRLDAS